MEGDLGDVSRIRHRKARDKLLLEKVESLLQRHGQSNVLVSLTKLSEAMDWKWRLQLADRERIRTKYVKIFILHETDQGWLIALAKHSDGRLRCPIGKVEQDDLSLTHAAVREVTEQTGLNLRTTNLQAIGRDKRRCDGDPGDTLCGCFVHVTPGKGSPEDLPFIIDDVEGTREGKWLPLDKWWEEVKAGEEEKEKEKQSPRDDEVGNSFKRLLQKHAATLGPTRRVEPTAWKSLLSSEDFKEGGRSEEGSMILWEAISDLDNAYDLEQLVQLGEKAIGSKEFRKLVASVVTSVRAQGADDDQQDLKYRQSEPVSHTEEYLEFELDLSTVLGEVKQRESLLQEHAGEISGMKRSEDFIHRMIALGHEVEKELRLDPTIDDHVLAPDGDRFMSEEEFKFWADSRKCSDPTIAPRTPTSMTSRSDMHYQVRKVLYSEMSELLPIDGILMEKSLALQDALWAEGKVRMSADLMMSALLERAEYHRGAHSATQKAEPEVSGSVRQLVREGVGQECKPLYKSLESVSCWAHEMKREVAWFEHRMVWMCRWMMASWESQALNRGPSQALTYETVNALENLRYDSEMLNGTSSLVNRPAGDGQSTVEMRDVIRWRARLRQIKKQYEGESVGLANVERPQLSWHPMESEGEPWTSADAKLTSDGADEYHRWVMYRDRGMHLSLSDKIVASEEGVATEFTRPCVFDERGLLELKEEWLERDDIMDYGVNLCLIEEKMRGDQEEKGLTIPGELSGDTKSVNHKPRILRWLLRRKEEGTALGLTGLTQLGLAEMTIPDMIRRWRNNRIRARAEDAERTSLHALEMDLGTLGRETDPTWPTRRLAADLQAWLDEIDMTRPQDTMTFIERQWWIHKLDQEEQQIAASNRNFDIWKVGRGPFSEVDKKIAANPNHQKWRIQQTDHLLDLHVVDGRSMKFTSQGRESDEAKSARLKEVRQLWKRAHPIVHLGHLVGELEREREGLRRVLEKVHRKIEWAREAEARTTRVGDMRLYVSASEEYREFYQHHIQHTDKSYLQELIAGLLNHASVTNAQIDEVGAELAITKGEDAASTKARESFNQLFRVKPKWDICNQHVEDTLMILSVMIHNRQQDKDFEPLQVMSMEEVDKTDWTIIQIESEELAKTEVALAAFHEKYLREDLPELRPDKFPVDLWALTRSDRKQAAHEAWGKFTKARLEEVIPKMMKIDISRETAARRREEPYLRAQILCNIDTWVYPDEDNPPMLEGFEYTINLIDPKVKPFKCKQRRYSILERFSLRARCLNMLEKKKIRKSTSEWASPPRLVAYDDRIRKFLEEHKEDTMEALHSIGTDRKMRDTVQNLYRFTSDMRRVNEATKLEIFPLPNIPDLINKCQGKDRYTCLDLEDAFFVVRCAEESRHLTAFMTPDGLFEYMVMVQGGKSSANVFAKIVSEVFHPLRDQPFLWYQDDLVNHENADVVQHMEMQEKIHEQCRRYHLILKPAKAHVNFTTQRVLGYIVSKEGRSVDPNLVSAITKLAIPRTLQNIQSLLGLAQVAREYIPSMATVIAPLQALARKGVDVEAEWTPSIHGVAFDNLKKILTTAPVLLIPDVTKKFRVHVDCCRVGRGCGAVLLQENSRGEWQPVAYWSRSLTDPERKLSATALEATAMHDAILHWKVYLSGGLAFEVITDHYALVYMVTKIGGDIHGRMSRMVMDLQGFSFSVTHRSGSLHLDADAVSRLLQVDEEPYVHTIDDLRDDFGPLTEEEKRTILRTYPNKSDAEKVVDIIDTFRLERLSNPATNKTILPVGKKQNNASAKAYAMLAPSKMPKVDLGAMLEEEPAYKEANQRQLRGMQKEEEKNLDMSEMVDMPDAQWARDLLEVTAVRKEEREEEGHWINADQVGIRKAIRMGVLQNNGQYQVKMVTTDIDEGSLLVGYRLEQNGTAQLTVNAKRVRQTEDSDESGSDSGGSSDLEPNSDEAPRAPAVEQNDGVRRSARVKKLQEQQSAKLLIESGLRKARQEEAIIRLAEKAREKQERAKIREETERGVHRKKMEKANEKAEAQARKLSDFNSLVMKHFSMNKTLYEVVNTYQDKSADKFMAMVQEYDDEKKGLKPSSEGRLILPILGPEGVQVLTERYEDEQAQLIEDDQFPTSEKQWAAVQREEPDYQEILETMSKNPEQRLVINRERRDEVILERKLLQPTYQEIEQAEERGEEFRPEYGPIKRSTVLNHCSPDESVKIQIPVRQILVPLKYRRRCLVRFHEELGHPGTKRMLRTVARTYYWKQMKEDVRMYVHDCHYCHCRKSNTHHTKPPVQSYTWPVRPFFRIHMDLTELSTTTTGYRYVLVIKDALTKWIELIPLRTKTATEVVDSLVQNVILRHGVPVTLITDKGSENCNAIMEEVVRLLRCQHISTTPYNPRSDGLAENQMRTLKDQLASWTNKFHNDWDKHLQKVAHAYRVTVNDATGFTPYYLNHGRECNTPAEEWLEDFDQDDKLEEYAETLRMSMLAAWDITALRVVKNVETFNRVPRRHIEFEPYEVGQYVFLKVIPKRVYSEGYKKKKHKLSSKLQYRYVGPFRILRKFNDVLYEADVHNSPTKVHAVNMKPV